MTHELLYHTEAAKPEDLSHNTLIFSSEFPNLYSKARLGKTGSMSVQINSASPPPPNTEYLAAWALTKQVNSKLDEKSMCSTWTKMNGFF